MGLPWWLASDSFMVLELALLPGVDGSQKRYLKRAKMTAEAKQAMVSLK